MELQNGVGFFDCLDFVSEIASIKLKTGPLSGQQTSFVVIPSLLCDVLIFKLSNGETSNKTKGKQNRVAFLLSYWCPWEEGHTPFCPLLWIVTPSVWHHGKQWFVQPGIWWDCACVVIVLVLDFSLLEISESPRPKLCLIKLICPTVACSILGLSQAFLVMRPNWLGMGSFIEAWVTIVRPRLLQFTLSKCWFVSSYF